MRPYGINRYQAGDLDTAGCRDNGRNTRAYSNDGHSLRSLRNGKKAKARRLIKRQARNAAKQEIVQQGRDSNAP